MEEEQENINRFLPGEKIITILNQIKTGTNSPLRIILLTKNFEENFEKLYNSINLDSLEIFLIEKEKKYNLWEFKVDKEGENVKKVECPKCNEKFKFNTEKNYKVKNYLVEFLDMNILILVSNDKTDFEHLTTFFNGYYPLISKVFYRAEDLRFILNKINDKENIEVIGRKCVVKRLFDDRKTIVTYQENTIKGIYDRAKKENGWIDSIQVRINPLGIFSLSRKGVILYYQSFNFKSFFEIILNTIVQDLLIERRKILRDKSRTVLNPGIKPIILNFENKYFSDKENIEKLAGRLKDASSYEVSILYISTGFSHIEVYDYSNGGSFDIYINSEDKLTIVPQTQANEFMLEGLILKISDIFEGVIK